jgi:diguanylate cyclase (GGDEF)-like protein
MAIRNALFVLLMPALLLAAGLMLFASRPALPISLGMALPAVPYVLGAGVIVLGAWFKSPRVALMAALVMGAHGAVGQFVPDLESAGTRGAELMVLYGAVAALFPVNALLIATKRDRGMVSRGVLVRGLFFTVQVALLIVVWDAGDGARTWADEVLHTRLFDKEFDYWSLLPQPAIGLFGFVSLALLVRAAWSGGAIDGGLFGAVAASALALHSAGQGSLPAIMFTLALLALLAAVVQESYRLAFIDELTGLPGRRALMHDLQSMHGLYTVAMLDVDHFKKFNDTYGHDVGDQVLKMVASRMMRVTGGGRAFRYGGEEFTVLFPRKDVAAAVVHLDKLREAIAGASFRLRTDQRPKEKPVGVKAQEQARQNAGKERDDGIVSVTISIGAHEREEGQALDAALKAADQALYRAKDGGRNRVAI